MKIGTCIRGTNLLEDLRNAVALGVDTVELYYNETLVGEKFTELVPKMQEVIGDSGIKCSGIGLYCNPLVDDNARKELRYCIENAHILGTDFVATFAGAIPGKSVYEAIPSFKEHFTELTKVAEDNDVKLGIENAHMYGHWYRTTCNIGFCPRAWEMMFHEVPSDHLGLEWEPSHQVEQLIDPIKQLKEWLPKVFHVHGKDAKIDYNHIKTHGIWFGESYCNHCFPGMGDTDWKQIIDVLSSGTYKSDITIEGYHDPVYHGDTELLGQKLALKYLKNFQK